MEALLAGAAIWLSLGFVKGIIWLQQMPEFMSWFMFYGAKTEEERVRPWTTKWSAIFFAIFFTMLSVTAMSVFGPLIIPRERMRYFGPYGSAYIAGIAARIHKIPRGVEPLEFESWEQYQARLGDDPQSAMHALTQVPFDKLPDNIKDVITVAKGLHDMQQRDVEEVDEDEEFRKDDKDE